MADRQFKVGGMQSCPADWTLPASLQIILKTAYASFNGSGAASSFLPCLRIKSDSGDVAFEAVAQTQVAAGASADVTWFPWWRGIVSGQAPSPNPLGTLWAWWDFSDTTTISLDGSGNILQILDKTGNGHNALQSAAAQRPAESTLNGLNCGLFNSAIKTALITAGWPTTLIQPFTVALVWTQTIASGATYQPGPIGGAASPPPAILFDNFNNTDLVMEQGAGSIIVAMAAPYTQQQASLVFNAGSSSFRLNGTAHAGSVDGDTMTNFALGASHFPTDPTILQHQDGKIGEVLVYEGALTAAQLSAVESYLKVKWATP